MSEVNKPLIANNPNYIMDPYDDALAYILKNGERRKNRTGVDTISVFGYQCRYRIDERFPILTRRKVFPKSIFGELLWMLSGSTNVNDLEQKYNSKIWSSWRSKEFEEKHGYSDGELGPIYGWSLRHFGEDYSKRNDSPKGFDQISYIVNELKNNRESRRILFTYWNPVEMTSDRVRLPSCHHTFMLNVDNQNRLSGNLWQRSGDYPIGICANNQYYSGLIYMLAQQCGYTPFEFIHHTADSHIYENQIPMVEEYLAREKPDSPKLELTKAASIFDYKVDDFKILDYSPLPSIKIPVAI